MHLACGTAAYMAPEVLTGDYDKKCDLWSTGVVVFILLMGYMPFASPENKQEEKIKASKIDIKQAQWSQLSEDARDFVLNLLTVDPAKRLSAPEALEHRFLKDTSKLSTTPKVDTDKMFASMKAYANASKFRRACLSLMIWSLTTEDLSIRSITCVVS
mmetsp:Transcript_169832/g.545079  ORF Transcript_169832/g.545079 Transcript_169832/m.545079 type:complete len:158 (+) Transcript_169832:174-647(+)